MRQQKDPTPLPAPRTMERNSLTPRRVQGMGEVSGVQSEQEAEGSAQRRGRGR